MAVLRVVPVLYIPHGCTLVKGIIPFVNLVDKHAGY